MKRATKAQVGYLAGRCRLYGMTREQRLQWASSSFGRVISSFKELSRLEVAILTDLAKIGLEISGTPCTHF